MRKIKFRVWDKKHRQFDDSCYFYVDMDGDVYLIEERNKSMMSYMHREEVSDHYEVMQYTGLTDRNGKEIYEGDIIKTINAYFSGAISKVSFQYGMFKAGSISLITVSRTSEVIGNIYEHPHLLED